MIITNLTRKTVIATKAVVADSIGLRIKGLLGKNQLAAGEALIIKPCNSIHTFGMRFAIDVVFIDRDNKITGIIHNLRPNRITGIYYKAYYTIELPSRALPSTLSELGDIIQIS